MARTYHLKRETPSRRYRIDYEAELNPEQLAVATAGEGPFLVIAGAGSGKTRALTYRVARLIESGIPPEQILLLTFTNRAAREMLNRVDQLVGPEASRVWGGTFHSVGRRILREHAKRIGFPHSFGIIDREDAETLVKQCIADLVEPTSGSRFPRAGILIRTLSRAHNTAQTVDAVIRASHPHFVDHIPDIERVLLAYQSRKYDYGVMDFDDLLVHWLRLLEDHEDLRESLTRRFLHVLVDEYQDTNATQAAIVDAMASGHGNMTVVGDDCQSIYSFRGADFRNIIGFPERHSDAQMCRLETNYRSTPQILALANASIAHNRKQFEKHLQPVRADGPPPALVRCRNEQEQSAFVAQRLLELRDEEVSLDQIAVLYRAHWQSMQLQIELGKRHIPFRVHSGQRFFEQRHVKDILAFLRFAENPRDELAFQRAAVLADGVGIKTAQRLYGHMRAAGDDIDSLSGQAASKLVGRRGREAWGRVAALMAELAQPARRNDASASIDLVVNRLYEDFALRTFDNGTNRLRELDSLATLASQQGSGASFLETVALATELTGVDQASSGDEDDEHVILSSIHQAKGLEFHTVFLIWLAEDRFPSARATESAEEFEEERRLFYVATTRAQQELYLMSPTIAWERGVGSVILRTSQFVDEVARARPPVLERWDLVGD